MMITIERRLLQAAITLGSLVPFYAGGKGVLYGALAFDYADVSPALDSHIRYLSGLLFALGLAFVSCIPAVETKARRFALLALIVFAGGLARLYGVVTHGDPGHAMTFGLLMELIVTPALCLWVRAYARVTPASA